MIRLPNRLFCMSLFFCLGGADWKLSIRLIPRFDRFPTWTSWIQCMFQSSRLMLVADLQICRLEGGMTPQQRDATIQHFMNNPGVTVFLISLKAGGVALVS
jgi:hypothetical protein